MRFRLALLLLCLPVLVRAASPTASSILESVRLKYDLPALAGVIVTTDGWKELSAVGVRKRGAAVQVTAQDEWHLGSDTKTMTAMLVGILVSEGKLSWDSKVLSFFPEWEAQVPAVMRGVTLGQLLAHEAGLADDLDWFRIARQGTLRQQRRLAAEEALQRPAFPPGTYHYSNAGYIVVAAILEKVTGEAWEDLITEKLFRPLGMTGAGFGRAHGPEKIDEPWPHLPNGAPLPESGYLPGHAETLGEAELPQVLAPAGLVHCSLADWSHFLSDQLRGAAGLPALLPASIYRAMQTPQPHSQAGYGWGIDVSSRWPGGTLLNHNGSDLMNYAEVCLFPGRRFGVAVCTNQGGEKAAKAVDEAVAALTTSYLDNGKLFR